MSAKTPASTGPESTGPAAPDTAAPRVVVLDHDLAGTVLPSDPALQVTAS